MGKVQFIKVAGQEMAIMPRAEYERLLVRARDEDAGTRRLVRRAMTKLARGEELALPKRIADRMAAGENPIRIAREWRGLTQIALAEAAGIGQGYLSDLEGGRRKGQTEVLARIARALEVPIDMLVP